MQEFSSILVCQHDRTNGSAESAYPLHLCMRVKKRKTYETQHCTLPRQLCVQNVLNHGRFRLIYMFVLQLWVIRHLFSKQSQQPQRRHVAEITTLLSTLLFISNFKWSGSTY